MKHGMLIFVAATLASFPARLQAEERAGCPINKEIVEDDRGLQSGSVSLPDGSTVRAILDHAMVDLDDSISMEQFNNLRTFLRNQGATIVGEDPDSCSLYVKLPQGKTMADFITQTEQQPGVFAVNPDLILDEPRLH